MRVLMVGPDRSVHGGISGVVNNYYEAGLDQRIDLCYIGTMVEGSKIRKLVQAVKAFFQFLVRLPGYEIVHVNMASDSSYYRKSIFVRTAKAAKKKIVIHQHGGDFEGFYDRELSDKGREKVRKVLSMGDAFLVLAPPWKEFFGKLIGTERITVLPDAISIPPYTEKKHGVHKILFLGRICKAKGIGELLAVMPKLKEKYPDVQLYLGGIFEDKELEQQAYALKDQVTCLSWVTGEKKERYLRECDIFVLPSYFEGQSIAILEAMANSCAVVASGTGGIPQMIIDGETGILIEPRSESSLQEGMEKVLSDDDFAACLGERAREKAVAEFSIENNMERLIHLYEGL
ncbi:MAG: glycosyltransferase family 4 protein [Suilimivivens sp.]